MKLGDVLKKERRRRELSVEAVAEKLAMSSREYGEIEAGESPAELWAPRLARIAIALETPTSRLLAESGRSEDCRPGQAGRLIRSRREQRGCDLDAMLEELDEDYPGGPDPAHEFYEDAESGKSELEKYGPLLLRFAEVIEQPVFNLFYPCGLPFQELDDYP